MCVSMCVCNRRVQGAEWSYYICAPYVSAVFVGNARGTFVDFVCVHSTHLYTPHICTHHIFVRITYLYATHICTQHIFVHITYLYTTHICAHNIFVHDTYVCTTHICTQHMFV